jgi:ATP-dependent RNA helicase RhlE
MADIERFTKQKIEVQVVEGFGPEPGERAEPIAMGRQTIWGGAGKPPSRDVMQAAAKAARTEMLQRVRDNKAAQGGDRSGGAPRNKPAGGGGGNGNPRSRNGGGQGARASQGQGRAAGYAGEPRRQNEQRAQGPRGGGQGGNGGQPDPLRTGTDSLSQGGRRRGGGGGGGRGRSGGQGGSGGGGGGVDPLRTNFGRISH